MERTNMTINTDCATMWRTNPGRSRPALCLLVVCLWNCFHVGTSFGPQVMASASEQPNHPVPRARFASQASTTGTQSTTSLSSANLGPIKLAGSAPFGPAEGQGGNSNNLKYVNYTRAQIGAPAPTGPNESETCPEPPLRLTKGLHTISRRSPDQQQQQFGNGLVGPPKLVQWSKEAVHYYEGSTLVLSCSLSHSGGEQNGKLKFAWFKQGKPLASGSASSTARLSIETLADYSFLRLADLRASDSGAYTCVVSNSINQEDRTTTQVIVNVKLKWLPSLTAESPQSNKTIIGKGHLFDRARAGQSVLFECNAAGGTSHPRGLTVRWFRLMPSSQTPADVYSHDPHHNRSLVSPFSSNTQAMDEARIRKSLLQLDPSLSSSEAYDRIELINSGSSHGGKLIESSSSEVFKIISQHPNQLTSSNVSSINWANGENKDNDFKISDRLRHSSAPSAANNQIRWRIESNTASPGSQFQQNEVHSRLVMDRVDPSLSGLYECEVITGSSSSGELLADSNGLSPRQPQMAAAGDRLRKLFGLFVHGK